MECKGCQKVYKNVKYGFYQYEKVLRDGTVAVHTQQPCKMCLSKRSRARYLSNKEKLKEKKISDSVLDVGGWYMTHLRGV